MDIFERDAAEQEQEQRLGAILGVWATFRVGLSELIDSYNHSPDGEIHPAKMTRPSDESLIIDCPRGAHPKQFLKLLTIIVRAELVRGRLRIACEIECWSTSVLPTNMPLKESGKRMSFDLDGDGESLLLGTNEMTPYEAAEFLLATAFRKKRG
jgi:hypothetical protein